jgi:putative transposase
MAGKFGVPIAPRTYYAHLDRAPSKRALWEMSITEILVRLLRTRPARPPAAGVVVWQSEDVGASAAPRRASGRCTVGRLMRVNRSSVAAAN